MSNSVKPGGNFVVLDLSPATWYNLRVTAHNNAGSTVAEYEFATLTLTGGNINIENRRPFQVDCLAAHVVNGFQVDCLDKRNEDATI